MKKHSTPRRHSRRQRKVFRLYDKSLEAFTLIELLLVIAIIAILMAIVIAAVNPVLQLAKAEDARRTAQARELRSALIQYQIDKGYLPNGINATPTPVCAYNATSTAGCVDLDALVEENYLVAFTPDSVEVDSNRLGYTVSQSASGRVEVTPVYLSKSPAVSASAVTTPITGVGFYYRGSAFAQGGSNIQAAIDTGKIPVTAGALAQSGAYVNISNYSLGINGLVLEIPGLTSSTLSASDFVFRVGTTSTPSSWALAAAPSLITALPNDDRVVIEWPNNAIQDTWLQVIVLPTANTGLTTRRVQYFGSVIGETNGVSPYRVTGADMSFIQAIISATPVSVDAVGDVNKSGFVTSDDLDIVSPRVSNTILLTNIQFPAAGSLSEG